MNYNNFLLRRILNKFLLFARVASRMEEFLLARDLLRFSPFAHVNPGWMSCFNNLALGRD